MSPLAADGLLALLVTVVALDSLVGRLSQVVETDEGDVRFRAPDVLGVGLLLIGTVSITWRRRAPMVVLLVSSAAFLAYEEFSYAPPPLPYAPLTALYTVSVSWAPVRSAAVTGILAIGVVLLAFTRNSPILDDQFFAYVISVGAAWGLGYGVQLSRARTALVEERAVQLAREQDTNTRLAVERERARIARELHDIVAHNVSVIVAQSTAAQRVFQSEPDYAQRALNSIEGSARAALVEMRLLLGVLQPEGGDAERGPQPGLDQLVVLLAQIGRAGLPVELVVQGTPRPLPTTVELNAYRIVQEALTNALRHAGPARAEVVIRYDKEVLRVRIHDDGRGDEGELPTGHGLVGMRQRVALLGGELRVGPTAEGGFEVSADLPVDSSPP
jgi:signal transduction histidine kinase